MPVTITEKQNLLSLLSIEVLISHLHLNLGVECHLPCIIFRLLDYPPVSIPYFDQWQVEEFHHLKKIYANLSWSQLLSDQFYELRSPKGTFPFKRGKSCLFKTYFTTLHTHLLNVPLFILLTDQIHAHQPSQSQHNNTTQFIGSGNVKLNGLIDVLHRSIVTHGTDIPLVQQESFRCTLFNLMGTQIGSCDLAVRFCHYGTTILTHLPMLNDQTESKVETHTNKPATIAPAPMHQTITLRPATAPTSATELPSTDRVVRHLRIANEKKHVGLQLSHCDLPLSSQNTKSAQTRWTSMKSQSNESDRRRGTSLFSMEDPSVEDSNIVSYQPPPLYFNSDSDSLHMITPQATKVVDEAKKNRLAYLASIPIASFDDQSSEEIPRKIPPKRKVAGQLRSKLPPSSTSSTRSESIPKKPILAKDFLSNFPLLRALVEEALALQQLNVQIPLPVQHPSPPVNQQRWKTLPTNAIRSQSARSTYPVRAKSVIVPKKPTNKLHLYPPVPSLTQMTVTSNEVKDLVNRLSKPRVQHESTPDVELTPRVSVASRRPPKSSMSKKPPPTYKTTRAHQLLTELSRARRAKYESPPEQPLKPTTPPRQDTKRASPQSVIPSTPSPVSLLNKVDVDTTTIEKSTTDQPSLETIRENTGVSVRFSPTASQEMTPKVHPIVVKTISIISDREREHDGQNDDLNFSITDVTDYFTEGDESTTRPPTRQSK